MDNKKAVSGFPAWNGIGHREVSFVFKKARGIYLMKKMVSNLIKNALIGAVSVLALAGVANAATVTLTPVSQTVPVGDPLQLTVVGSDFPVSGVTGGSVLLTWDPGILQLDTTQADAQIDGILTTGFSDVFIFDTSTAGQLEFTALIGLLDPPKGQSGAAFDFLNLSFTALAPPGSDVSIGIGAFGDWQDGNGDPVSPVAYVGATVNINAVPVPAAVWLFSSGLLGMIGIARRRRS